jgi:ubiquinone/menaquinone biosynthesis C-methylase UbiE
VAEVSPRRVLEAGCGTGELAERVLRELGAEVVAVDISARMVALTAARGIDARVADVQTLPFEDAEFDVAVANWVLYHAADVDLAIGELARVLRPGGRLVAATVGVGHMREAWALVGGEPTRDLSFWSENGEERLRQAFPRVERRDALGTLVFPDAQTLREFVAASITRAHLAENVPEFEGSLETRSAHVVFVAEK